MKENKSLPYILSMLSICVVGLVLVQAYWIFRDYDYYRSQPLFSTSYDYYIQEPIPAKSLSAVPSQPAKRIVALEPTGSGPSSKQQEQKMIKSIPATVTESTPYASATASVELTKFSPVAVPVEYFRNKAFWQLGFSVFLTLVTSGCLLYMLTVIIWQRKNSIFKSEFIDNMAHELLTPVSNIGLAIEGMKSFGILEDEAKTQVYLNLCKYETDHLSDLVKRILEQSVFDSGKMKLDKRPVDVNRLIRNVIERYSIADADAEIYLEQDVAPILVEIDSTHIINVAKNLIDNALRYTEKHKEVFVKNTIEKGYWNLSVRDNGIGIDKKYHKSIFDKFFRIKSAESETKGFGLGLTYVKQVAELHHGYVLLESGPDGSTFSVFIPIKF